MTPKPSFSAACLAAGLFECNVPYILEGRT
jgi:hypothetical protein